MPKNAPCEANLLEGVFNELTRGFLASDSRLLTALPLRLVTRVFGFGTRQKGSSGDGEIPPLF